MKTLQQPVKNSRGQVLFLLSLVFLLTRFAILLTNVDEVSNQEELYRGAIAYGLEHKLPISFWEYQADAYAGGSLVIGLLAFTAFKFFGASLFVLKSIPVVCFVLPSFLFLYAFLEKYFGSAAANFGAILFLFSPPSLISNSFYAVGDHMETMLFSVLMLHAFYRAVFDSKPHFFKFFGFIAGFGFWFSNISLLAFAACLTSLLILAREQKNLAKHWLKIAAGFIAGASPWIFYNAAHGFAGARFLLLLAGTSPAAEPFTLETLLDAGKRFITFWLQGLPVSFAFKQILFVRSFHFSYLYYFLSLSLLLPLILRLRSQRNEEAQKLLPLFCYILIFSLAFSISSIAIPKWNVFTGVRYFIPLHFIWILLLGIAASRSPSAKKIWVLLAVLGAVGFSPLLFREPFGRALVYKSYSLVQFAKHFSNHPRVYKIAERFAPEDRKYFLWGSYRGNSHLLEEIENDPDSPLRNQAPPLDIYFWEAAGISAGQKGMTLEKTAAFAAQLPERVRPYFFYGAATAAPALESKSLPEYLQRLELIPEEYRLYFYYHLSLVIYDEKSPFRRQISPLAQTWTPEQRAAFYRGAGADFASNWIWHHVDFQKAQMIFGAEIPPASRPDFYWGLGWGIRMGFKSDLVRARDWIEKIPAEGRALASEGFKAWEKWYEFS